MENSFVNSYFNCVFIIDTYPYFRKIIVASEGVPLTFITLSLFPPPPSSMSIYVSMSHTTVCTINTINTLCVNTFVYVVFNMLSLLSLTYAICSVLLSMIALNVVVVLYGLEAIHNIKHLQHCCIMQHNIGVHHV